MHALPALALNHHAAAQILDKNGDYIRYAPQCDAESYNGMHRRCEHAEENLIAGFESELHKSDSLLSRTAHEARGGTLQVFVLHEIGPCCRCKPRIDSLCAKLGVHAEYFTGRRRSERDSGMVLPMTTFCQPPTDSPIEIMQLPEEPMGQCIIEDGACKHCKRRPAKRSRAQVGA